MNPSTKPGRQNGAATLVVVMVLFLVMAMMAAYGNRNIVFEQRISSNYYRANLAFETAEAGIEWTLGMLNGDNVDQQCRSSGAAGSRFRTRYARIDTTTWGVTTLPGIASVTGYANCAQTGGAGGWVCSCPDNGMTALTYLNPAASANSLQSSFVMMLVMQPVANPLKPGIMRVRSRSCTSGSFSACANATSVMNNQVGEADVLVDIALVSALKNPPASPLTVKGALTVDVNGIGLHNTDPRTNGLLLTSGRPVPPLDESRLDGLPGSAMSVQQLIIADDMKLRNASTELMFTMFTGMPPNSYRDQPAMRMINCPAAGDCSAVLLAAYNTGVRMAWVAGPLTLSNNVVLGTAEDPMVIVSTGNLALTGPLRVSGMVYTLGDAVWNNPGGALSMIQGVLLVDGDLAVTGRADVWYHGGVINQLRNASGSYVRVPGSWWN